MSSEHTQVRELVEIHAHKKDFFLSRSESPAGHGLADTYIGNAKNDFCSDSLSISIFVQNAQIIARHFGEYCALAHASAEIFCKNFYKANLQEFIDVLTLLHDIYEENNTTNYATIRYGELISLFRYPMSSTRKICILLPVRASMQALQKV